MALRRDPTWNESLIRHVVETNDKQRFAFSPDGLKIRANQGHSIISIDHLDLKPITDISSLPSLFVIHGTYLRFWQKIKTEGLKKMSRNHVHLAKGMPGTNGVISGMRSSCEVYIHVDAAKMIADGIPVFESANGVILCEFVHPKYFLKVIGKDGNPLP